MKNLFLALLSLCISFIAWGQTWEDNLPQDKLQNGELTLSDYQKAFNDYWDPYNVEGGYYYINGEKIKAPGWKLFKRWEWKAEHLVDGDGNFAETSTPEELEKYYQKNPDAGKSTSGNWTNIGYNTTNGGYQGIGRVNCIAFHPTNNNTFWLGAPSGGLWKTTDGGTTWTVLTDNNTVLGVSAIAITSNYATSNTLYIGTGDRDGGSAWSLGGGNTNDNNGIGVLKSTDGGVTWTNSLTFVPSAKVVVFDLLIDPTNNNILYAATDAGIYKTINAGGLWTQINNSAYNDLEFQPGNSSVIYAAFKGTAWITKFTGGGATWTNLQLTTTTVRRTELAVSANNASVVYALTVNSTRGLEGIYKSTDAGVTYSNIFNGATMGNNLLGYNNGCTPTSSSGQGTYDVFITANPSNANDIYVGGINVWRSTNGGSAWSIKSIWVGYQCASANEVHADQHCCEFHPGTNDVYIGNDGGIYYSTNNGTNWTDLSNNLTINQIYRIGVSPITSNEIIIGLQDNGTHVYSGGSWVMNAVIGGDGMECLIDPTDNNIQFGTYTNGQIYRTSNHWSSKTDVRNLIRSAPGASGSETGAWVTPYMLDPNNKQNLFVGYDEIWKSTDQGTSSANFSKITVSSYSGSNKMRALQIAPSNSNYIYVSYSSSLHRTTNGGSTWANITGTLPVGSGNITYICVKNDDPNTVWVTIGGYNSDAVYQTTNGGTSWTNISGTLPQLPAMSIVQNKLNTGKVELYVAMTQGVWVKYGSSNWVPFKTGLPNVFCTEMEIYYDNTTPSNSKIRVGTFGRGLWESDLPIVDFSANNTMPANSMTTVLFSDLSTNSPTGWMWTFNPNTVTFVGGTSATSQNPQVQFNNPGAYTITLTTANAFGNDAHSKTAYIHMGTPGLWTGTSGTAWNTGTNWHNHLVPTSSIGVTINPGAPNWPLYTGNLDVGTQCGTLLMNGNSELTVTGNLTIPAGKTMTCNANSTVNVDGDFVNYGTFTPGNSVVKMNGTNNSTISGNQTNNGSQTTNYVSGTGWVYPGAYIDIVASGGKSLSINSFDIHCNTTLTVNVEIWYKSGTYSGFTSTPGVWTQLGTTQTVTGQGFGNPTSVNPGASVIIPSGSTYGFYINCYSGSNGYLWFSGGSNSYSNSDISINTGDMTWAIPPGSGSWNGYTFNGTVFYSYVTSNPLLFFDLEINKTNALVTTDGILTVRNDLTVSSLSDFTNATGNSINVIGNMNLKADATGMASYLDNGTTTISGSTSVEEYLTSQKWHLVSPPLSGATINTYFDIYLKQYNEPTDTWTYLVTPTTTPMTQAQGYSAWASDSNTGPTTVTYNGSLTNSDIPISSLSYTSAAAKAGFNLIGNPYPCALDWNSNWSTSNLSGWMVIYDNGTYRGWHPTTGTYNGKTDGIIPSTQGFWVRALSSSGSLIIPASERLHSNQPFYKDSKENIYPTIRLESEINGLTDETVVVFHPDCSSGFDGYYDLTKFANVDEAPTIYTISGNENYGVNFYGDDYMDKVIPVGFKTGEEGLYSIVAKEIVNFDEAINVYLEDLKEGIITELNSNPEYEFSYNPMDEAYRFNLHFKDSWYGVEDQDYFGINIYAYEQTVYIQMQNIEQGQVSIYNIMGQEIINTSIQNTEFCKILVNGGAGYYLVKVHFGNQVLAQKVLIK